MPKENEKIQANVSDVLKLRILDDVLMRSRISSMAGVTFRGNRDLYEVLGYKRDLTFQSFWDIYERGRLAKRIINAPVESTWYGNVSVYETQENEETEFEKAWNLLDSKFKVISKLIRFDKLIGLGEFAVLLMGFDDSADLSSPIGIASKLLYLQPYHQGSTSIVKWVEKETDERYAMPEMYMIKLQRPGQIGFFRETRVHFSRLLHVADNCLENDIFGSSRLKSCYNTIEDLEKLAGGSAEMFWQGALGGKAFAAKDGAALTPQTIEEMGEEIDEYVHGLRRYLRLQNIDVKDLSPDLISAPKEYLDIQLDLIAGDTGIPKRILVGSERGELASSQDESNWLSRIEQRRIQFAEPFIIRPFVDKLIEVGVLPKPKNGYQVNWPDLWSISDEDRAKIAKTKTETLAVYVNSPGIDSIMPEEIFLEEVMGFDHDLVERVQDVVKLQIEEGGHEEENGEKTSIDLEENE